MSEARTATATEKVNLRGALGHCAKCGIYTNLIECGLCGAQLCLGSFKAHIDEHRRDAEMHRMVHQNLNTGIIK